MNFPFYIAKRYLRSKSSQNAVNIINFITFLVIVIGSAALFIVLSGFSGLKTFSISFSNIFDPDLKATALNGKFFTLGPEEREDLRELLHITIDGEDAKDFDDAVCVEKKRNGFCLWVSIADVGAYVRPGSRLDLEAYERGTSVYFPGTVIPMLPENLSNNLCSLLPNKDRLAVTVVLDFDRSANLKHKRILRSIIRSSQRFTYDIVKDIIIEKDPAMRKAHKAFLTPLKWASELARALRAKRMERGSIRFSIPEAAISLNPDGTVKSITKTETHFAHQMIEEFMLAANEAVADTFIEAARKTLFRVHEKPDPEKVSDFVQFAATLGFTLAHSEKNPAWFNEVIDKQLVEFGQFISAGRSVARLLSSDTAQVTLPVTPAEAGFLESSLGASVVLSAQTFPAN